MKLIPHQKSPAVNRWIRAETGEQKLRYKRIAHRMNEVDAPKRARRYAAFLERIQVRGFSVNFDQMRLIGPAELPREPRRKHRVVF
ncbi:MAG: hypothetical protein AMXMBFR45_12570 [Gammaproteobacteria bacterium]|nr:MAG: hypothetical protein EDM71_07795 [Pseudomonadota bacterium]MBC6945930.1 hypothetical protein [Gammaproteobacteria bacterium]MCE7895852.1 hypothetical protein [Gammaproteobacteria bacterium PRO8]MDL1881772.1 hypothetical protein [Gammaproteobacteria bacterium PRO2]MCL4776395.1 hypothetical protein [Gammaproteobacteria bacterium]